MTTARDITIYQGQAFALSLDYAGTAGRGQRMHIRLADSTATVVQILTHNGDANARVIFDTAALDITIGASVSAGWVVLADRVEWVYDIEDYDLADEDDCVIPYCGKVIVRGNRTRASDVTPSDQMPSGDGRYVRFDGVQGLSAGQQLQARENIGATLGTGDVVGPASATDGRIAEFDGITGKLIRQGSYTITALLAAAWARASHTGTQLAATISDFASAAITAVTWSTITGKPSTFDPSAHKTSHATGGGDALTASDIGAATAGHDHTGTYQPLATVLTNTTAAFTTVQETKLAGIETAADVTDAGNVGTAIDGATAKTTPVDADTVPLIDSAAGNVLKKLSWANIKATAKTYFDTLYQAASAALTTWAGITPGTGVATALGTNVGSAGAFVTNGGALGTPSSGTLTNATGLPPAGITQSGATSNQVLAWNGSAWAPATASGGSPGGSSGQLQYNNASAFGGSPLWVFDANTVWQRNSTTAQALYVSRTYTDGSNYERGFLKYVGTELRIGGEQAGTGAARDVCIYVSGVKIMTFDTTGKTTVNHSSGFSGGTYKMFQYANQVNTSTSTSLTLAASDYGSLYVLNSASDQNWTHNSSPIDGCWITLVAGSAKAGSYLRSTANTGQYILLAGGKSAAAGYVRSNSADAVLRLRYVSNRTMWIAEYQHGTWTIDS